LLESGRQQIVRDTMNLGLTVGIVVGVGVKLT